METILIATDLSARSDRAVDRALMLAREHNARLTVVHAYHVPFEGFLYGSDTHREIRKQCQKDLTAAIGAVMTPLRGEVPAAVEPRCLLCHGETLGTLRQQCQQFHADLLAIGTHGRTGLAHAVFGSIAEFLLRNPPCDVVAVRTTAGTAA